MAARLADASVWSSCERRLALGRQWQEFLMGWLWEHFLGLTFRDALSSAAVDRRFRSALAAVEVATRAELSWVKVQMHQSRRPVPHVHALLRGGGGFAPMRFLKYWERYGWARVGPIYDRAGAVRYVVAHIVRGADVDFSANLRLPTDGGSS